MNKFVQLRGVKKFYKGPSHDEPVKALDGIDLEIGQGQILGLIGESGSGKSTLGRVLVGLDDLTSGEILYDGTRHSDLLKKDRLNFYKNVQMIFQNPYDVFDSRHTIRKILEDALKIHKIGSNKKERTEIMVDLLERGSLRPAEDFLSRYPSELSGGQLQRIAILRSMRLGPKFLVADEPVTMLDVSVRSEIINLLLDMRKTLESSIIFISHDIATTSFISERIAVMYLGQIVEEGETEELLSSPSHPYTIALLSNTSSLKEGGDKEPIKLRGDPPTPVGLGDKCYFSNRCFKAKDRCFSECPRLEENGKGRRIRCFYPL